ncbi:MAG: acyl-protein synthase [Oligoflexales bacterium]
MSKFVCKVPDQSLLQNVEAFCLADAPYDHSTAAEGQFIKAMNEVVSWHSKKSDLFAKLCKEHKVGQLGSLQDIAKLPFIHANFFKMHEVLSIPRDSVYVHLTSSGTTGQKSQIFFDEWSLKCAQRMVESIFKFYKWEKPNEPTNYLLFTYEPHANLKLGTSFTDNYLCQFTKINKVFYALRSIGNERHEFDVFGTIRALQDFAEEGLPVRILGFPSFMYFTLERFEAMGCKPLHFPEQSMTFFGGGWKGHADKKIEKADLYARIERCLGFKNSFLRDGYGSVEHCIPYVECSQHEFHVPTWSRVLIRDVRTLQPLPDESVGYLQFVSPYITSVPAVSVLMGDLASLHKKCGCGLSTPFFRLHGRAGVSKNKSCALAAAELLKGKSA